VLHVRQPHVCPLYRTIRHAITDTRECPIIIAVRRRAYIHHLLNTHEMLAEVLLMMYVDDQRGRETAPALFNTAARLMASSGSLCPSPAGTIPTITRGSLRPFAPKSWRGHSTNQLRALLKRTVDPPTNRRFPLRACRPTSLPGTQSATVGKSVDVLSEAAADQSGDGSMALATNLYEGRCTKRSYLMRK
jgi:hypothetical protein